MAAAKKALHAPRLNPEVQNRIVQALRAGNYLATAAQYAGVSRAAVYVWLNKGEDAASKLEAGDDLTDNERVYYEFADAVARARSEAEVSNVALIKTAAQTQWQAAAWMLERSNPRQWGRRNITELVGADDGPVNLNVSIADLESTVLSILRADDDHAG
jgi:hypothetical protein